MCNLWRLKNDFITKILKPEGFGFINGEESTIGRTITDDVCDACFIYYLILNHFRQGLSLHSFFVVRYNQECLDQDYNMTEQNIKYIMCECALTYTCIRDICTIGKFIFKILMFILIDHSTPCQ